ncbi:fucose isomerase [Phyllobacterium sp. SYP-B3895]|uniref:fucose isomerase n=1 Tax=Phyllobacterium sp. SYP-B3895 TaxID=2663240 RepID=UPI001299F627|nr:fucose isomerase [Phyllobacterium sp. SYP-B3895]MRG57591.1 fucose isomerase [Phyllobacterium sp. SYP-B3895]
MTRIMLVASGDLRESANVKCWPAQAAMERKLTEVLASLGHDLVRAHPFRNDKGHGFIASQREGMDIFATIDPAVPLIVAEAVWQYSHHVLAGLVNHSGPILTVANWAGEWPGLVGLLNLNGSLTKAGVAYSTLWSETFDDTFFRSGLKKWLETGRFEHDTSHAIALDKARLPAEAARLGRELAKSIRRDKVILGVFDEGCMGMYNAIIPDELLMPLGFWKERLSQSALYHATMQVSETEARQVYNWMVAKGMTFHFGDDPKIELTEAQVIDQCRMYIAVVRIADAFGCEAVGIQYQQGLKDLLPASDLVEGMLNNDDRPDVIGRDGKPIKPGEAIVHFNEVDECAALDGVMTNRVHRALGQPVENTLHDIRWGDIDRSGGRDDFIWVFEISGAAPPAHHEGGWAGSESFRQPAMFFPAGGGTLRGVAKAGELVWSRIFVADGTLHMDIGRGQAVALSEAETERRSRATNPEWPIMHAVLTGVDRDAMMARHKANHVQVVYGTSAEAADAAMWTKAALAAELGISVNICGFNQSACDHGGR